MLDFKLKNRVIKLRMSGSSVSDIVKEVSVSKSTVQSWLRGTILSEGQYVQIGRRSGDARGRGRASAAFVQKRKRIEREVAIIREADAAFETYKSDPIFTYGLALYASSSLNRQPSFLFSSADPNTMFIMSMWVSRYLGYSKEVQKFRLYFYKGYEKDNLDIFWANFLGIKASEVKRTIYKKAAKKRPDYKGSLRMEIGRVRAHQTVLRWQKRLAALILSSDSPYSSTDRVSAFEADDLGSIPGGGT